jgi:Protein of unknown function (DUF2637)
MAAERVIRWTTAGAVVGVAAVAAVASYEHAFALVRAHGEAGWTGRLVPLTVDGLIYASSMVMLDSARRKMPVPALARWLLGVGIAARRAGSRHQGGEPGFNGARLQVRVGRTGGTRTRSAKNDCDPERMRISPRRHSVTWRTVGGKPGVLRTHGDGERGARPGPYSDRRCHRRAVLPERPARLPQHTGSY